MNNLSEDHTDDLTAAIEQTRQDFAAFGDPGSSVSLVSMGGNWYDVSWEEDAQPRTVRLHIETRGPSLVRHEGREQSYASFLSGPHMGNLRALARNALHVITATRNFVPSQAMTDADQPEYEDAIALLSRLAEGGTDKTAVVFLAADAGVGKTVHLKHLVREKASAYLSGQSTSMWLYVDAQARRLAALDEALAGELDRLRARFSFDAAIPLVRCGALTLVIDGFDELIGSVGAYDEAFNSLADFISGLSGRGAIVAAARSAYYEEEFLARVGKGLGAGEPWELRPVRLSGWSEGQRRRFVLQEATLEGRTEDEVARVTDTVEELLAFEELTGVREKPFFVDGVTRLVMEGDLVGVDDEAPHLLDRLVTSYIARDGRKLLSGSREPLLSDAGLRAFFDELAIEMWRQESRELSRTSLRELAAIVGELEGLDEDGIREVAARAPYFGMLRAGSTPGGVGWEHDVYFAYFLARPLATTIESLDATSLGRLLRRGRLPEDGALLAGRLVTEIPTQVVVDFLSSAGNFENIDIERVRRNAGLLAAGRLANLTHDGLRIQDLILGDIDLGSAAFAHCQLHNVQFAGTILTQARFVACEASGSNHFDRVRISPDTTRFEITGVLPEDFHSLVLRSGDKDRVLYSPHEMRQILNSCGLPSAAPTISLRTVDTGTLRLLDRLCRIYGRTNVVVESADNDLVPITSAPEWPDLRRALIDSGLVVARIKSASGHKVFLERVVRPEEIMAGLDPTAEVDSRVNDFWDRVAV